MVNIGVVVLAELLLLFNRPLSQRCLQVAVCVLAADHESNLAGWVGWDRGVCVFDVREDFFAVFLELGDQRQVKPLVLG